MAGRDIVVRGVEQTPAQGLAGDAGPAGPGARAPAAETTVAVQPVQVVDSSGQPVRVGGVGLEGPLLAALAGALIAQGFAAWAGHRFRRRDAEIAAFDHAFKAGMALRGKASSYAIRIRSSREEGVSREAFLDALTEFRAAVVLYLAVDDHSQVAKDLESARAAFAQWDPLDLSEPEIDDRHEEQMIEFHERGLGIEAINFEFADSVRVSGNEIHEALQQAVGSFAVRSRRPWWRR